MLMRVTIVSGFGFPLIVAHKSADPCLCLHLSHAGAPLLLLFGNRQNPSYSQTALSLYFIKPHPADRFNPWAPYHGFTDQNESDYNGIDPI